MAGRRHAQQRVRRCEFSNIRCAPASPVNPMVASYGTLKADTLPLAKIADCKKAASALVDKVGFDN